MCEIDNEDPEPEDVTLCYRLSEASLAVDRLRPEEDEAWAYLQPDKQKH